MVLTRGQPLFQVSNVQMRKASNTYITRDKEVGIGSSCTKQGRVGGEGCGFFSDTLHGSRVPTKRIIPIIMREPVVTDTTRHT